MCKKRSKPFKLDDEDLYSLYRYDEAIVVFILIAFHVENPRHGSLNSAFCTLHAALKQFFLNAQL